MANGGSTEQTVRMRFDISDSNREQKQFLRNVQESSELSGAVSLAPVEIE
jgi:hypothetical protein